MGRFGNNNYNGITMGLMSFLEKRTQKIATKRVQKIAADTASVMISVVENSNNQFNVGHLLKPQDFARMSIYGRTRWSTENETLLFDGIETEISFTEGTDLADVVSYVVKTELLLDMEKVIIDSPERLIILAESVAREYVKNNAPKFL
jgi:hypothetical protein